MSSKPSVALFDFDGTLTQEDSFLPFLRWTHRDSKIWTGLFQHSPTVIAYFLGKCSNQTITETLVKHFYQGWTLKKLQTMAVEFAHQSLPKLMDAEAIDRLKWHQSQGHQVIVVSAALNIYLQPWANMMQVDQVLANDLEAQQGCITGKLQGKNCHGVEKVRRIEQLLGNLNQYHLYAYGDSEADRPMLAIADESYYRKFGSKERLIIR